MDKSHIWMKKYCDRVNRYNKLISLRAPKKVIEKEKELIESAINELSLLGLTIKDAKKFGDETALLRQ